MKKLIISSIIAASSLLGHVNAAPQSEYLDRGVIAVYNPTQKIVFVSWRSLSADDKDMTFDVYRDGKKLNSRPLSAGTHYTDRQGTTSSVYVIKGSDGSESKPTTVEADVYKRIHLDRPAGGTSKAGGKEQLSTLDYTYSPNDCSVGDVDGDGEYEIFVKWDPSNSADNSERRFTGNVYIDCYKLDGTKLWRVDLGQNIRAGAHYTQFLVYDFDGDGKAEMICKTRPGAKDGNGDYIIMNNDDPTKDYRIQSGNNSGIIKASPEYLTVFDGLSGKEINTIEYKPLFTQLKDGGNKGQEGYWGDNFANRSERYLAAVAYLDGQKPSAVFCRGYYHQAYLWAVDFDGKQLKERWFHASEKKNKDIWGEGAHSLTVGDVDGDGFDEIVYGAGCIDHDGSTLYRTGGGHGDALHLGDFDPDREGLEIFMVHEETGSGFKYDSEFRDAKTGEIIWYTPQSGNDIGRGLVGDISDTWRGYEIWPGSYFEKGVNVNATFDCHGNLLLNKRPSTNFRIYWDGDLLDELFDGRYDKDTKKYNPEIVKRNASLSSDAGKWTFNQYNAFACNTTKATPCLQADILGDWREELILWDGETSSDLLIFTTMIESKYRVPCLMEDHNYRMAIAWQNVGYNQPPHLGFYLADRFSTDAKIKTTEGILSQTIEIGFAIKPIKGAWEKAKNVTANGLPEGVSININEQNCTFEISGTPKSTGTYKYKVLTTGGETTASLEGTITVNEPVKLERVAYFPFEEVGATVSNLVYGSAKTIGSPNTEAGIVGNAIRLNNESEYLIQDAYDDIQMGSSDFTIEFAFKSSDNAAYIFHKGSIAANATTGTSGHWIGIELKNDNLYFAIDDNVTKTQCSLPGANAFFDDKWHHIVCTRNNSTKTLTIYIDGAQVASATDKTGAITDNNEPLCIGNVNVNLDNPFTALIDELSIYKGAMSASKVEARYKELFGLSAINEINNDRFNVKHIMLVDAHTGIIVGKGMGEPENICSGVAPGVYILVTECGAMREAKKIIIR